jgi:hypothetical protein
MKTKHMIARTNNPRTLTGRLRSACATRLLLLLLLLLPAATQAQYTWTTNNGAITITGYNPLAGGDVTIPDKITGLPVASIATSAFSMCSNLTSVKIGTNVTSIGNDAFYYCTSLNAITVDALNSFYGSIAGVLFNKSTNTLIQCPPGKAGSYTVPKSVTSIGDWAFEGCISLTGIYFQGNAPSLGYYVFFVDRYTTAYYLPDTTGWDIFNENSSLAPAVLWNPQAATSDGSFGVQANQFGFNVTGTANIPIVLEVCTNLASPVWVTLLNGTLTNGSFYFSDPDWANYPSRFYRFRSP